MNMSTYAFEKRWFDLWLEEADSVGWIFNRAIRPESFTLENPQICRFRGDVPQHATMFGSRSYTPDYCVVWELERIANKLGCKLGVCGNRKIWWIGSYSMPHARLYATMHNGQLKSYFEIRNTKRLKTQELNLDHKRIWTRHGVFINKVCIGATLNSFFDATWTPKDFIPTPNSRGNNNLQYSPRSIADLLPKI